MLLASASGALLDANPEACAILGYGREELLRVGLHGVIDTSDPRAKEIVEKPRLRAARKLELRLVRRNGTAFLADVSVAQSADRSNDNMVGIMFRKLGGVGTDPQQSPEHHDRPSVYPENRFTEMPEHTSVGAIVAGTDNGIVTTAATDSVDGEMAISNYGPCVDLWAPGAGILSTRKGGGTSRKSGTSMAAPHMGGGAALYLSSHPGVAPSVAEAALKAAAVRPGTTSKDGRDLLIEQVGGF